MQLIYDRTEADVLLGNEKGRYSHTDLNRVESAVAELQRLAGQMDIYPGLTTKTNWGLPGSFSADSWPAESQMQRFLGNVHALCSALEVAAGLPDTMSDLTWQGANAIELALQTAYARVMGVLTVLRYSGEIYSGEEISL